MLGLIPNRYTCNFRERVIFDHGFKMLSEQSAEFLNLPIESIEPNPWQPRKDFDPKGLQDLASSLLQDGILQPLVVSRHPFISNRYFVIAGERRLRAAKLAGLKSVPANLKVFDMERDDQLRVALIENIQRSNLNVIEEGKAYRCLIERFQYTHEECAKKLGKDRVTITNALRILLLPDEVQEDLVSHRMSAGHARALSSLGGDTAKILHARALILKKELSVRETESLCKALKLEETQKSRKKNNPDLQYIQESLESMLSVRVNIKGSAIRGRIELGYSSKAELEKILEILKFHSAAH